MHFTKMNGAGNDFIVLDAVKEPLAVEPGDIPDFVRRLCGRHTGVGADGVMILRKPAGDADVAMAFYNSDGSMGEMCGNGARCVCRYAYERGYAGETVRVETAAGLVTGWRQKRGCFRIRLNTPSVLETEKTLTTAARAAIEQIHERRYYADYELSGVKKMLLYGMAFCGKRCFTMMEVRQPGASR